MDVHTLAQTPVFLFSLVTTGIVAAYTFGVFLRTLLGRFSAAVATSGVAPVELMVLDLARKYREQLVSLRQRVDTVAKLSFVLPGPFQDQSWTRLLNTCDALERLQQELNTLIGVRDFPTSIQLARFLTGVAATAPTPLRSIEEAELMLVIQWKGKTTALLQRMVAKLEDAALGGTGADGRPLSPEFLAALNQIRQAIILDEEHHQ